MEHRAEARTASPCHGDLNTWIVSFKSDAEPDRQETRDELNQEMHCAEACQAVSRRFREDLTRRPLVTSPLLHLGIETNRFWHSQERRTNFLSQKHRGDRASSSANHTLVATEPQVLRQDEGDSGASTDEECLSQPGPCETTDICSHATGRTNADTGSRTCTPLLVHPATETESERPVT